MILFTRRRAAYAIRIRQELAKRLERREAAAEAPDISSLRGLLVATSRKRVDETEPATSAGKALLKQMRQMAPSRGLRLPTANSVDKPHDVDAILAQAETILAGNWQLFSHELQLGDKQLAWRTHPISNTPTPLDHFSLIHYAGDHLGGDVKYIWELNRHFELLRMAQAYHLTQNEAFVERITSLLDNWIDDNPPNRGINWVAALEVSFRAITWCWVWKLTAQSEAWTPELLVKFLHTIERSANYLLKYDSIHHSPNTHLTGEALGLLYIGTTFPELKHARRWKKRGIDILVSEIPHQFLEDGFHFERATGYHRYNLEFYLHALALARGAGERWGDAFVAPLHKALDVSAALRKSDGDWPVFGDEDGGSTVRLWASSSRNQAPLLALGAALLGNGKWLADVAPEDRSLAWWFGLRLPAGGEKAQVQSFAFPQAGYFGARDMSPESWYCVVDAGPHGGKLTGHAHTDLAHTEIAYGNQSIIVDPGCSVYGGDAERRGWYRSLAAHATVIVDDNPLAIPRGIFGWEKVAPTPSHERSESGDFWSVRLKYPIKGARTVTHERQVILLRQVGIFVIDFLSGAGAHSLKWRWPLGMSIEKEQLLEDAREVCVGPVVLSWSCSTGLKPTLESAPSSPTYGAERTLPVVVLEATNVDLPVTMVSSFRGRESNAVQVNHEVSGLQIAVPTGVTLLARPGSLPTIISPGLYATPPRSSAKVNGDKPRAGDR